NAFPLFVGAADFNGDGITDLVSSDTSGGLYMWLGVGDGTFHVSTVISPGAFVDLAFAIGDYNGDGIPDLAVANNANNNFTVMLGNGDGTFLTGGTFSLGT